MSAEKKLQIAIVHTNPDVVSVMERALNQAGYLTAHYIPHDWLELHVADSLAFFASSPPDLVVYDIVTPYGENIRRFKEMMAAPKLCEIPFLLTTIDRNLVENIDSSLPYAVIRGLPFDVETFVAQVSFELASKNISRAS